MSVITEAAAGRDRRSAGETRARDLLQRALAEPVAQFFLIGGLLLLTATAWEDARARSAQTIVVDAARVTRLSELYRAQMGAPPTAQQLRGLVDDYVRDEALYREARRRNLGADDEIVRRRLIQKMAFLQASEDVAEPTEAQLRGYYDAHAQLFVHPASVTFDQVFFDAAQPAAEGRAQAAAAAIAQGQDWRRMGDPFPAQARYEDAGRPDVQAAFGPAVTSALFSRPSGRWSAPLRSPLGWHLVRVKSVTPAEILPFERVRENVRDRYLQEAQARADATAQAAVLRRYVVRLPRELRP